MSKHWFDTGLQASGSVLIVHRIQNEGILEKIIDYILGIIDSIPVQNVDKFTS